MAPGHSTRQPLSAQALKPFVLELTKAATAAFRATSGATGHKRGNATPPHLRPHGLQLETPSASPPPPVAGSPRATPRRPPPSDFKLSPACPEDMCVTWHSAPSIPQQPDALTCPMPDALSSDHPNSSTCNTEQVDDRLSCNLKFWWQIGASILCYQLLSTDNSSLSYIFLIAFFLS